ncbi:hypothetical protein MVEN_00551300 [Mycena venus]|uniref:Uncharacterized protein n=1 Tax=Mycena venus TaxID=2733690 RepID=A0A8H6YPC9_9AGAR|nr:hypothetical protein MVEN_00551300 [Mycena venus]
MARPSVSIELSTSRISRLLRPLRTKCIALAAVHPTSSATTSTYGSKPCSVQPHLLEVLPPPDTIRSYHVDHRSVASLRAALYAVRDSFREIVVKTKPAGEFAAGRRVPRLADLCSTIVGQNMEGEEDSPADAEEDSEEFSEMENIEKLYEIIPVQYRRSALLAHSLDIILRFPHHFTLLSILFDVCLQHDLYHESCVLLHLLLRAAVSSASGAGSVPLCHPANSNYLLDLCRKWRGADHPTSVFIRMLSTVLVEAPRSELWGCKALAKFTRELHSQDFQSLIDMASQIVSSLADVQVQEPQRSPTKHRTVGTKKSLLMDQLNVWLNYSSSFPPADSILEFLERCYQSGVHRNSSESLAATVACWATHFLPSASREIHPTIYRLLQDISPTVTTYSLLVRKCLDTKQAAAVKLQDSRTLLQGYAGCLRTNKLLVLEASLWACALRFVETSIGAYDSQHELSLYREELMDLVECAERRCFGSPSACQNGFSIGVGLGGKHAVLGPTRLSSRQKGQASP